VCAASTRSSTTSTWRPAAPRPARPSAPPRPSAPARPSTPARHGTAESLPVDDASVDLISCRDVLAAPHGAYAEFQRVRRPGGRVLVYQMFATGPLHPAEAEPLFRALGVVAAGADPDRTDQAIADAGFTVDAMIELGCRRRSTPPGSRPRR
jgi:hypothetical protein